MVDMPLPTTRVFWLCLVFASLLGAAQVSADQNISGTYTVIGGDYLSKIARHFGVTVKEIKQASALKTDVIHPGQKLTIPDPFRRLSASSLSWSHPFHGRAGEVLRTFGPQRNGRITTRRTGVEIAYPPGSNILAPAHGVIRYSGDQDGYGVIVIMEHGGGYVTVLGPFEPTSLQVETGSMVRSGDVLGRTGDPAEGNRPYLHVELRHHNQAVDPSRLID
jgi:murein DD-endopeptidase MepM/ murein hydrolase activator NlpD